MNRNEVKAQHVASPMASELASEYRRLRKENPSLPAKQAILWAKGNLRPLELDWEDGPGWPVALTAQTTRGGFDIRINVTYDEYGSQNYSETDVDTGIRNPRFRWEGDEYSSRGGKRFIALESDNTVRELAPYLRKMGASKNVAWEDARESLRDEAAIYMAEDYSEYVITVRASVNGTVLGDASIGGVDVTNTWGERFYREIEDVALHESMLIEEAIDEARESLAPAIEKEREHLARMEALVV